MALVKFISGDGVEHEVEHDSLSAGVMRTAGFQEVGDHPAADEPFVYTLPEAIAQNEGLDESTEAKEAAEKPAKAGTQSKKK